ncbi:MAG: YraN family protein [Corynebacterium sp.]|nr:YraN family protein [Corynebacterium sp.]
MGMKLLYPDWKNTVITRSHRLGRSGERAAARYLESLGWQILAANVRYSVGEIDLIARDDATIVFVEVKTRSTPNYGSIESITPLKLKRMRKAAVLWLRDKPYKDVRFDVITIVGAQLEHFEAVA